MPAGRQLDREGLGFFDRHESAGAGGGKEPDRLPVDFMGTASCMVDAAYYALRDRMGLRGDARMFRRGENTRFYDDRILEALGVDFRRVWLREPPGWGPRVAEDGTIEDGCGLRRRRIGDLLSYVNAPLEKATVDDLARYPWPDPNDPGRVEGLAEKARQLHEDGRYAIVARAPTLGMFDLAQRLRGMQQFLMDLLTDKPFALALIHKPKEMQMGFYEVLLNAVGPYVDIVETGDDYGAQNGPLISPSAFREMISPARRELNEWIKSKAPGVKIFLHSDGAIFKLIPMFIEIGVDILNPVEPEVPGNAAEALKKTFGQELIFHGHLDNKRALRGSLEDVRREVRRAFDGMGPGGAMAGMKGTARLDQRAGARGSCRKRRAERRA